MVIEPINKNDKDGNDVFTSAVARTKSNKEQQTVAAEAGSSLAKKELPKVGNAHAASSPRIYAKQVELEDAGKESADNPLSNKEVVLSIDIFGKLYKKEELAGNVDEIVNKFFAEFVAGNGAQTKKLLKSLPKELQSKVVEKIMALMAKKESGEGLMAFGKEKYHAAKAVELYHYLMSDSSYAANFSKDQKNIFAEKIKEQEPAKIYQGIVAWLDKVKDVFSVIEGSFEKANAVIAKDTKQLEKMTVCLKDKKNITDKTWTHFNRQLEKMALILKHARIKITNLRKVGKDKEANELENIVMTMENQFNEFVAAAEAYKDGLDDDNKKVAVDNILNKAKQLRDSNIVMVADYLKERAEENVVIALNKEAYDVVNSVVFLDKEMFCANSGIKADDIAGVFADNYDLLQDLENLKIANNFVSKSVYEIVEKDKEARRAMREQLLADLQEIEKFYEQFQKKLKEEEQKIAKFSQQKAITTIEFNVREYANIVKSLIDLKGENLEWYKCQLDNSKQEKIASIINGLSPA